MCDISFSMIKELSFYCRVDFNLAPTPHYFKMYFTSHMRGPPESPKHASLPPRSYPAQNMLFVNL